MRNKTIFIADSGLGDFIVATGWINYYCKKYNKKALLLLGNPQREYFNLLKINYEFELIKLKNILVSLLKIKRSDIFVLLIPSQPLLIQS